MRRFAFSKSSSRTDNIALFVCAVSLWIINPVEAQAIEVTSHWIADWTNHPAKPCYVLGGIGKYIEIENPSPQIQEFRTALYINNILWCDSGIRRGWGKTSKLFIPRTDQPCSGRTGHLSKIEIDRQRAISQFTRSINLHIFGRSIAAIHPSWTETPEERSVEIALSLLPKWTKPNSVDKRSFICNQGIFRQDRLETSGPPKGTSEGCYDDSCQSSYASAMTIKENTRTSDVQANDGESGWIFFGGGLLAALLVPAYAALKMWREGSFRNYRRSKHQ